MNNFQGIRKEGDPKDVNLDKMVIPKFDKKIWKHMGYDIGQKLTKKQRKDFPYKQIANDSEYFEAFKEFYDCVDKNTKDVNSLTVQQMEAA